MIDGFIGLTLVENVVKKHSVTVFRIDRFQHNVDYVGMVNFDIRVDYVNR